MPRSERLRPRAADAVASSVVRFPTSESAVILLGNPNVGKSVLFKNLTDRYVAVSNYPGTTVDLVSARGRFGNGTVRVVDTPGLNDLDAAADDARVSREVLAGSPDATVVQVADAKNLRRALLLTLQLAELGRRQILVLNMRDELAARGGRIDEAELERILGIPVVSTVAVEDHGTAAVIGAFERAAIARLEDLEPIDPALSAYEKNRARLAAINRILAATYQISQPRRAGLAVRLGFWAMHPIKGLGFVAVVLLAVFWFVGLFGAGTLVDLLEVGVFEQRLSPLAIRAVDAVLPFPHQHAVAEVTLDFALPLSPVHEVTVGSLSRPTLSTAYALTGDEVASGQWLLVFTHDLLVGRYGAITMALSYALAIVLPIVSTFFLVFSLLEDSGYLPRMAVMVNRVFRLIGLNGKAVLPMVLGLGCDTMATMTTRILETRRERLITTMLLALAVPCSAQLGVLLALLASLAPLAALLWLGLIVGVLFAVGWLSSRVFDGERSDFVLELPPMRRPRLANVAIKTASRLNWYLKEVLPLFVAGTGLLFLLDHFRLLGRLARLGEPLVSGWLGLPAEMANAFLVGFLRRDFGAVYVLDAATGPEAVLSGQQIFVAMVTITLFMPCFANFLVIAKEHGQRVAWAMSAFIFPFAFAVGGAVNWISRWLLAS